MTAACDERGRQPAETRAALAAAFLRPGGEWMGARRGALLEKLVWGNEGGVKAAHSQTKGPPVASDRLENLFGHRLSDRVGG